LEFEIYLESSQTWVFALVTWPYFSPVVDMHNVFIMFCSAMAVAFAGMIGMIHIPKHKLQVICYLFVLTIYIYLIIFKTPQIL
jgi:uncharacterized membrane protein YfcA